MRKEAKKLGMKKGHNKKGPGIPNSWPFKASLHLTDSAQDDLASKLLIDSGQAGAGWPFHGVIFSVVISFLVSARPLQVFAESEAGKGAETSHVARPVL